MRVGKKFYEIMGIYHALRNEDIHEPLAGFAVFRKRFLAIFGVYQTRLGKHFPDTAPLNPYFYVHCPFPRAAYGVLLMYSTMF